MSPEIQHKYNTHIQVWAMAFLDTCQRVESLLWSLPGKMTDEAEQLELPEVVQGGGGPSSVLCYHVQAEIQVSEQDDYF